jgi:hypothetical protein
MVAVDSTPIASSLNVEDQPAEQGDADRGGQLPPRKRRELAGVCGGLGLRSGLPDEPRGEGGQRQADRVEPERRPPVRLPERAAEGEEDGCGDRGVDDLQAEVALALVAVEVVGQQGGAAGHDRRLGEADEDPGHQDQL